MNILEFVWLFSGHFYIVGIFYGRDNKAPFLLCVLPFVAHFSFKCWVIIPFRDESKQHGSHWNYKHAASCRMSNLLLVVFLLSCVCGGRRLWERNDECILHEHNCYSPFTAMAWYTTGIPNYWNLGQTLTLLSHLKKCWIGHCSIVDCNLLANNNVSFFTASLFTVQFSPTFRHMSKVETRSGKVEAAPIRGFLL